jgi:Ribbon-helix-helix protein, copG family
VPAVNPRIAVYLPRNVAATVQRLAALRGVSRSAVIRDFLVEAEPVMARVANLLDLAARSDRNALKEWAVTLEAAQSGLEADATAALATMRDMETDLKKRPGRATRAQRAARPRRRPGQ